jgi:hypothetical protein
LQIASEERATKACDRVDDPDVFSKCSSRRDASRNDGLCMELLYERWSPVAANGTEPSVRLDVRADGQATAVKMDGLKVCAKRYKVPTLGIVGSGNHDSPIGVEKVTDQ